METNFQRTQLHYGYDKRLELNRNLSTKLPHVDAVQKTTTSHMSSQEK